MLEKQTKSSDCLFTITIGIAISLFFQALGYHLKKLYNNTDLGFPYWDFIENGEIPDIFDDLKYPTIFERAEELGGWEKSFRNPKTGKMEKVQYFNNTNGHKMSLPNPYSFNVLWDATKAMGDIVADPQKYQNWHLRGGDKNFLNVTHNKYLVEQAMKVNLPSKVFGQPTKISCKHVHDFGTKLFKPHTNIHQGTGGIMAISQPAVFIPQFFLLHSAVDKYFADWQVCQLVTS